MRFVLCTELVRKLRSFDGTLMDTADIGMSMTANVRRVHECSMGRWQFAGELNAENATEDTVGHNSAATR